MLCAFIIRCICEILCCYRCLKCCVKRCCSVQVLLCLFFFLSTSTMAGTIILVYYFLSLQNVTFLLEDETKAMLYYTEEFTTELLESGPRIIDTAESYLSVHDCDPHDEDHCYSLDFESRHNRERTCRYFFSLYEIQGLGISVVGFGGETGRVLFGGDGRRYFWTVPEERPDECCPYDLKDISEKTRTDLPGPLYTLLFEDDLSLSGPYNESIIFVPNFEYRLTPWFGIPASNAALDAATNSTRPYWTHFVTIHDMVASSVSRNVFDRKGVFRGVEVTMLGYRDFYEFLSSLQLRNGILFMIDQSDGLLLGSTNSSTKLGRFNEKAGRRERILATESEDTIIREATLHLFENYADLSSQTNIDISTTFRNSETNEKWILHVHNFEVTGGFRILNIFLQNEKEVYQEVYSAYTITFSLCCSIVCFLSLCFCCSVCVVLYPLHNLNRKMKKVEKMDLEKLVKNRTCGLWYCCFFEMRQLHNSFQNVVEKLYELKSFLPSHVGPKKKERDVFPPGIVIDKTEEDVSEILKKYMSPTKKVKVQTLGSIESCDGSIESREMTSLTYDTHPDLEEKEEDVGEGEVSSIDYQASSEDSSKETLSEVRSYLEKKIELVRHKSLLDGNRKEFSPSKSNRSDTLSILTDRKNRILNECFDIGVDENRVFCILINISNWRSLRERNRKCYLKNFTSFLDFVQKALPGSVLQSFSMNEILLYHVIKFEKDFQFEYFDSDADQNSLIFFVVSNLFKLFPSIRTAWYGLEVVISFSVEMSISGVLGNKKLKRHVLSGEAVEKVKFLNSTFLRHKNSNDRKNDTENLVVLFDSKMEKFVRYFLSRSRNNQHRASYEPITTTINPCNVYLQHVSDGKGGNLRKGKQLSHLNYQNCMIFELRFLASQERSKESRKEKLEILNRGIELLWKDEELEKSEKCFRIVKEYFLEENKQESVEEEEGNKYPFKAFRISANEMLDVVQEIQEDDELNDFEDYLTRKARELEAEGFLLVGGNTSLLSPEVK